MARDLFTNDFKSEPYWWDTVPRPELGRPPIPAEAEVVIVGTGYTGLNAALVAARGGRRTVALDAEHAGWGCSTRNGGQISTSIKPALDALAATHGRERALAIHREGHSALQWIGDFVNSERIDCDFKVCGRFHAAHNAAQYRQLANQVASQPEELSVDAQLVPRAEQHRELGTDAYHGGVVYPHHAALDPARYHQGLLERALAAGVTVIPHCAVTSVERRGAGLAVETSRGPLRARDVIVATNGYTGRPFGWLQRRVIPIGSYIIATEPLAPAVMNRLMPTGRIVSDTRKVVYYYRPSPDGTRILFGGRVSLKETDPRISAPRLHTEMVKLFPELAGIRISHSWVGFVAYTFDTLAHTGSRDGIHYAMGYCGSGVSMASYLGMRAGQRVLGLAEGHTAFEDLTFQSRPLYTGNPWFLAPSVMYYRWRDELRH